VDVCRLRLSEGTIKVRIFQVLEVTLPCTKSANGSSGEIQEPFNIAKEFNNLLLLLEKWNIK